MVFKKTFEEVHDRTLRRIRTICEDFERKERAQFYFRAREIVRRADFVGRDLVIVHGGDGTLTSIAHNLGSETPVLGVNSHPIHADPNGSVGFYMGTSPGRFEDDLQCVFEGKAIKNRLPRLQAEIVSTSGNRIQCDPALNDLLIANTQSYAPSKYRVLRREDDGKIRVDENHLSSGMLFSTYYGMGAWFMKTVNLESIEFDPSKIGTHYLYTARDLPPDAQNHDNLAYFDWTDRPTIITSDMHRGFIVPDGWDEYHFNRGATITVGLHGPSLMLYTFDKPLLDRVTS